MLRVHDVYWLAAVATAVGVGETGGGGGVAVGKGVVGAVGAGGAGVGLGTGVLRAGAVGVARGLLGAVYAGVLWAASVTVGCDVARGCEDAVGELRTGKGAGAPCWSPRSMASVMLPATTSAASAEPTIARRRTRRRCAACSA